MALNSPILLLAGLIELQLPSRTVRLCDGGFVVWGGNTYLSSDSDFGTIESVEAISEGLGDEAPGARLTLLPTSTADAAALFQSSAQGKPIKFWLAEINRATGAVVGNPELLFWGIIDFMGIHLAKSARKVEVEFIAASERLFLVREGNVLSPRFHQNAWPGELGFDHCTGNGIQVPWGTNGPSRGSIYSGTSTSSGYVGGGGGTSYISGGGYVQVV
jgi:hypothetical protein